MSFFVPRRRNGYRPQVECLEGRIALGFSDPTHYAVSGASPQTIAVSDLDADGSPDIAVPNGLSNTVNILLNNGDGSFRPGKLLAIRNWSTGIAAADFDSNGTIDLAVTERGNYTIAFFPGNGDGTFGTRQDGPSIPESNHVIAADFNGDSVPDLAVSNYLEFGRVTVLLGNGDFTFAESSYAVGRGPNRIVAGDFNQDGYADLAVSSQLGGNAVYVLLNIGDGTFADPLTIPLSGIHPAVETTDFNGDGILDLAVTNNESASVATLLGNGDGTFGEPHYTDAGPNPWYLDSADFDQDGRADLLVGHWFPGEFVSVLLGNGDGSFQGRLDYPTIIHPFGAFVGDFNSDGYPDFVASNVLWPAVSVLLNDTQWGRSSPGRGQSPFIGPFALELHSEPCRTFVSPAAAVSLAPLSVEYFAATPTEGSGAKTRTGHTWELPSGRLRQAQRLLGGGFREEADLLQGGWNVGNQ